MSKKRDLFISSSLYAHRYVRDSIHAYYCNPKLYVEGQVGFQENYPTQLVPCPIYLAGEAIQYDSKVKIQNETAPIIKEYAFEVNGKVEEKEGSIETPYHSYMFETARLLKKTFPKRMIVSMIASPVDFGIMVFGIQKWIEMLLFERNRFDYWMGLFFDYHNRYKFALKDSGVDIISVSNILFNTYIIPQKIISNYLIPYYNKNIDPTIPTIIHSSFMPVGETIKHLDDVVTTSGYVINERDPIEELGKKVSGNKTFIGNLDTEYLYKKTPNAIKKSVMDLLRKMEYYDPFIIGTTGADLNRRTTPEQINAIYEGMKAYEESYC